VAEPGWLDSTFVSFVILDGGSSLFSCHWSGVPNGIINLFLLLNKTRLIPVGVLILPTLLLLGQPGLTLSGQE
jgi:hypothetical protein